MQHHDLAPGRRAAAAKTHGLLLALALFALAPCLASAQDAGGAKRTWTIEPSVSLRESFTDNQRLQTVKEADAITEANASVYVTGTAGALRGHLDYSITGSVYARHRAANEIRHFLNGSAIAEIIDGQGFVDLRANYSPHAISAFGNQSPDSGLSSSNRSDVGSLSISPYLRGRLGSVARYEARVSYDTTRATGTDASDVDNTFASLNVGSASSGSPLGWSASATHSIADYRAGRRTFDSRLRAGLNYVLNRELKLGVSAGQERTDMITLGGESNATWGVQGEWTPTERTSLVADAEKRFFGTAHSLRFSHRTPRTAWTVSDSRNISTSNSQGVGAFGSAYDLFFRQFASIEPDAVRRDVLVRLFMLANGINPNAVVISGFLSSAATLQRTQLASFALVGVRNTVTFQISRGSSERADKRTTAFDDLSNVRDVRQSGLSLDWSHRLTAQATLSLTGSYQRSDSTSSAVQTTLKSVIATWNATWGPHSTLTAGARRAVFDSTSAPYDENAVFASFRLSF